jgi:hypothetical protein
MSEDFMRLIREDVASSVTFMIILKLMMVCAHLLISWPVEAGILVTLS